MAQAKGNDVTYSLRYIKGNANQQIYKSTGNPKSTVRSQSRRIHQWTRRHQCHSPQIRRNVIVRLSKELADMTQQVQIHGSQPVKTVTAITQFYTRYAEN